MDFEPVSLSPPPIRHVRTSEPVIGDMRHVRTGRAMVRRQAYLRSLIVRAATFADVQAVMGAMLAQARRGDVQAAQVWLERTCGKAVAHDAAAQGQPVIQNLITVTLEAQERERLARVRQTFAEQADALPPARIDR